jgi:tRNA nucleotidyltransferase/poly(A) polymerase
LVITGIPARDLEKILNQLGTTKLVGKSFGVYKWKPKDTSLYPSFEEGLKESVEIDIALPRTETGWGTGGRRDFDTQTNPFLLIEEDLKRRDFTINSIAFDITTQKYIDPFGGQKDIQKKIIRTIGKPEERLKEDVSRILRAIRLACSLNFKIEQKTWSVIKKLAPLISNVTKEIIASEITQAFYYKPTLALQLFDKSGILEILIPEIKKMKTCKQPKIWHSEGNVFTHTQLALQALEKKQKPPFDPILVFGLLWHDIGKTVTRKKQKGKITFYNHQNKGLPLAQRIIKRLKLESAGVNKEQVK